MCRLQTFNRVMKTASGFLNNQNLVDSKKSYDPSFEVLDTAKFSWLNQYLLASDQRVITMRKKIKYINNPSSDRKCNRQNCLASNGKNDFSISKSTYFLAFMRTIQILWKLIAAWSALWRKFLKNFATLIKDD